MDERPPTLDDVSRAVAAFALALRPGARACRIVIEVGDGCEDVLTVPLHPPDSDDLEGMILAALGNLRPSAWLKGASLAHEIGLADPNNGHFRRVMAKLVRDGTVQSGKSSGYRLPERK